MDLAWRSRQSNSEEGRDQIAVFLLLRKLQIATDKNRTRHQRTFLGATSACRTSEKPE